MANRGSALRESPSTISLGPPLSANTPLPMLAVWPKSILLPHLTKFVFLVVEYLQVWKRKFHLFGNNNDDDDDDSVIHFGFCLLDLVLLLKVWVLLSMLQNPKRAHLLQFLDWGL